MIKNEKINALLGECMAYRKYGQTVNVIRVEQIIREAFKAGQDDKWREIFDPSYKDD